MSVELHRRRLLRISGGFAGASLLGACGGGGGEASSSGTAAATTSAASSTATPVATTTTSASTVQTPTVASSASPSLIPTSADFVAIPSGSLTFGEGARETVTLAPYFMNKWLVTNAQYKAFTDATGRNVPRHWSSGAYPAGKADHPVLWVSYTDAAAFAAWVTTMLPGLTATIPTEAQWENAARGPNGYAYPWGNSPEISFSSGVLTTKYNFNGVCTAAYLASGAPLTYANDAVVSHDPSGAALAASRAVPVATVLSLNASGRVTGWIDESDPTDATFVSSDQYDALIAAGGYTTPVGAYPAGASAYGLLDMAGNAFEWTSSTVVATNGVESGSSVNGVRGGSWYAVATSSRSTNRGEGRAPSGAYHSIGFRLAAVAK